jgi:hypothetical protein
MHGTSQRPALAANPSEGDEAGEKRGRSESGEIDPDCIIWDSFRYFAFTQFCKLNQMVF